jgi:peptide/nickel transport system permease protein
VTIDGDTTGRPRRDIARYVAGRMLTGLATLLVATVVVFAVMRLIPGSYADVVLPPEASAEMRATLEEKYGLNQPLPVQYAKWLGNVASGDFGTSSSHGVPVSELLARRVPVTIELALLSLLLTMLFGLPLALLAGLSRSPFSRDASRLAGALAMSTPAFVTGSLFLYLFSRYSLGLLVGEYVPLTENPLANLRAILLPAVTMSIFGVALVVRIGRDAIAGVLNEPHLIAAVSRGESTAHIVRHHVIRNAAIPVLTVLAIFAGELMGGVVIVESLFTLPGLGQSALLAINQRDYSVVQGVVLLGAAAFIMINMLADVAYGVIDPRIRRARTA